MRTGCSHPVSRFICFCSAVWAPQICQKTMRDNHPARQPASQTGSDPAKELGGCSRWFMLCSGMLNEFRIHCFEWMLLALSATYLYVLQGKSQNVTLLPFINLTWNVQLIERQTDKEMNHCSAPFRISCQSFDSFRTETDSWATCWQLVAKQKWKTLICITAPVNYSKQKFLRVTSASGMTLSACASLRGPCASVSIQHTYELQIIQTSGSHGHFLPLSLTVRVSKTPQSAAFKSFQLNRQKTNVATHVSLL